jgi:hypothetical protein
MKKAGCVTAFAANNRSSRERFQPSYRKTPHGGCEGLGSEAKAKLYEAIGAAEFLHLFCGLFLLQPRAAPGSR